MTFHAGLPHPALSQLPALLLFVCWLTMHFYPLAGKDWEAQKQALAEKHAQTAQP